MKYSEKENIAGYIFSLPSIVGFLFFFGIPFIMSIFYCFTKGVGRIEYVGFENFIELLTNNSFKLAIKNTILFEIVAVPLLMTVSLLISLMLKSKIKGDSFFRTTLILPIIIPAASMALLWRIIFSGKGFINQVLIKFGVNGPDYLNTKWAFLVLLILFIWKNCGYNMIIFLAGLNNIPKQYYEAASMDGCSDFKAFFKITLPLLLPYIFLTFIISIINSLKVYREAYLIFGQYPDTSIYLLQHFMNNNFTNLNYQRLSTASVISFIFIAFILNLLFKLQKKYQV